MTRIVLVVLGLLLLAWGQSEVQEPTAIFQGGSDSLAAKAIGAAEGTRTADGGKTEYWESHTDPGNGVRNQGTFSYQHGAASPEEADAKQLVKLEARSAALQSEAQAQGVELDSLALLNGLDLFNQSEAAGADFVPNLTKCGGKVDLESIVCARSQSYIDPATGELDAPGLGNSPAVVEADQDRRARAVEEVLRLAQ